MWVDVVCLRRHGVKLPPEELRSVKRVRGYLTIDTVTVGPAGVDAGARRKELARLWQREPASGPVAIDGLECARVSRVGGDSLLLVGVESRDGSLDEAGHPQAWWCRVVLEADADAYEDTVPGLMSGLE